MTTKTYQLAVLDGPYRTVMRSFPTVGEAWDWAHAYVKGRHYRLVDAELDAEYDGADLMAADGSRLIHFAIDGVR
jgi:hypothetical protein